MEDLVEEVDPRGPGEGTEDVNVFIAAVDSSHTVMGMQFANLPLSGAHEENVILSAPLSAWPSHDPSRSLTDEELLDIELVTCLQAVDPDGGDPVLDKVMSWPGVTSTIDRDPVLDECKPEATELEPQFNESNESSPGDVKCRDADSGTTYPCTKRYIKVGILDVSIGFKGDFVFRTGRDTFSEIAYRPSYRDYFEAGGWEREISSRGGKLNMPWINGLTNFGTRRLYAQYRLYKYHIKRTFDYDYEFWAPHHWTGKVKVSKNHELWTPGFNLTFANRLRIGETFVRETKKGKRHALGFKIVGVGPESQAGYSEATKMRWRPIRNTCTIHYLYGHQNDPSQVDTVYSWCAI